MQGLEDELLRNFQEAVRLLKITAAQALLCNPGRLRLTRSDPAQGVYEFAAELGIIEQGTAVEIGALLPGSPRNARHPDVPLGTTGSGRLAAADDGCARQAGGLARTAAHAAQPHSLAAPATTLGAEVAAAAAAAVQLHKRKRADEVRRGEAVAGVHAHCLACQGGEDDLAAAAAGDDSLDVSPPKKKARRKRVYCITQLTAGTSVLRVPRLWRRRAARGCVTSR